MLARPGQHFSHQSIVAVQKLTILAYYAARFCEIVVGGRLFFWLVIPNLNELFLG